MTLLPVLSLLGALSLLACGDKEDSGTSDGGTSDGGTEDGGTSDGGTTDGGTTDGGTTDGGTTDGGTTDGGTTDGGTTDGGTSDGGTTDGGTTDGGTTDGGTTDGGTTDGGTTDGGTSDGGTGDGGAAREDCTNEVDDDGDGLVDCDDDECARSPDCASSSTCPGTDLGRDLGDSLASGTIDSTTPDDFSYSCGSTGGGDVSFAWRVPADGCYTIDTVGSDFDTVMAVYESCAGPEIECDDDGGGYPASKLDWIGLEGEDLVIIVSAYSSSSSGSYVLNINESSVDLSTVDLDIGRASGDAVATGTFDGTEVPRLEASCGSSGGGDYLIKWVVPETGTWQLDTSESTFDTTLSVWSEASCGEIDCSDDAVDLTSALELDLTEGEEYVVRVALYSSGTTPGDWTLDINKL